MNKDELLRRDLAIYVSDNSATKEEILKTHYDNSFSNYFARTQTENAIRRK